MSPAMLKSNWIGTVCLVALGFIASPAFASDVTFTKPIDALKAYRERPLFAPNRRADESAPQVDMTQESPAAQPLNAVLLGVVSATDGSGLAVLRIEGDGDVKKLRIGESINGWQLDRVESHAAVFSSGGQSVTLTFPIANMGEPSGDEIMQDGVPTTPTNQVVIPVPAMPKQIINP